MKSKWSGVQWLIVILASIGFAFDIYELLMAPLILRPAILELTGAAPGSPEFTKWAGMMFYLPAVCGGIFGLLGGYLTDRLGRRRVLTWSILLYAFSAFAAGYSTRIEMLLLFRCTTFVGVCVEFVAAVAWLSELFTDPHERETVLGFTQAFSSFGGLMVAAVSSFCVMAETKGWLPSVGLPESILGMIGGEIKQADAAWRYTLMSGLIPALPLIFIRPFLPESPIWQQKKEAGTLKRPSLAQLFSPELRRTTLITALMFACSYGAAFGAIQQIPQIVPGLPEVREQVKTALDDPAVQQKIKARLESKAVQDKLAAAQDDGERKKILAQETAVAQRPIKGPIEQQAASSVSFVQEIGGLAGRFLLAFLAIRIVSRRKLLRLFQIPGLLIMPVVFAWAATNSIQYLYVGIFLAGLVTVGQFSFWGNYLPRVYPVHLRGTGESFAANIGGRLIGTSMAWVTQTLATTTNLAEAPQKLAYVSAGVGFTVYLVGFIASFWLPEPKAEDLPE